MSHDSNVIVLKGLTLTEASQEGSDRMVFKTLCGRSFLFYHSQDCCESVNIDKIEGNLSDLIGSPLVEATEVIDHDQPDGGYHESITNTTFAFATSKGRVVIKWVGSSNGYYSESVSFVETTNGQPRW